jgi:nitroreductase
MWAKDTERHRDLHLLAVENLMLAAFAMGLGTCCIGLALPMLNEPDIQADLEMPADVTAEAAIVVGVPRGEAQPVPRKEPEVLAWI